MSGTDGSQLRLDVLSPRGAVLSEPVDEVIAHSTLGELGVLAGHEPLLALLVPGPLAYRQNGTQHFLAVTGGFLEVGPERVVVLARTAERIAQIDLERAKLALKRRQEQWNQLPLGDPARPRLEIGMARARARMAAVELEQQARER